MYIFTAWNFQDDCTFSFGHCIVCRFIYGFGIYKRFLSKCCPHNSTVLCTGNSNDKTLNCQWSVINSLERWLHRVHPLGFNGVRVTRTLVLCVMLCRSLCVPLSFFFWPLHCLSFYLRFWLPLWHFQTLFCRRIALVSGRWFHFSYSMMHIITNYT